MDRKAEELRAEIIDMLSGVQNPRTLELIRNYIRAVLA